MKKVIKGLKIEDCGICKFCNSPLKKKYHFDGRPNCPSTVEYICKCPMNAVIRGIRTGRKKH